MTLNKVIMNVILLYAGYMSEFNDVINGISIGFEGITRICWKLYLHLRSWISDVKARIKNARNSA